MGGQKEEEEWGEIEASVMDREGKRPPELDALDFIDALQPPLAVAFPSPLPSLTTLSSASSDTGSDVDFNRRCTR